MVKKKSVPKAKKANGKSNKVAIKATPIVAPPVVDLSVPSFRDMKYEMEMEVKEFKDYLVAKYTNFHGHDLRKDVSWYMEQMGIGIASDIERVKREERQKLIAENRAREEEEAKAATK